MWERESHLWRNKDWMDSTYYSPSNKQELLEKQERDREFLEKFPKHIAYGNIIDNIEKYEDIRGI